MNVSNASAAQRFTGMDVRFSSTFLARSCLLPGWRRAHDPKQQHDETACKPEKSYQQYAAQIFHYLSFSLS